MIGLDVCGIDVIASGLDQPIRQTGGAIIEINAAPGLRMHLEPTHGQRRDVAKPIVDLLFDNNDGRIPIVAITGTNGKTTTTRLVAHMAKLAGYHTGFTTTDGEYINDEQILNGDCSGPRSAQLVLKDSAIDFAVLETARGGILRSGLGFDHCHCAVITNIASDHLGLDGIDTLEQLAKVKSVIAEAVSEEGFAVLNADDDLVYAMKDRVSCQVALFSMYPDNVRIEQHCEAGGVAAVYENGYILIRKGNHYIPVEEAINVPITFNGQAEFNIANALAACLAAYVSNIRLQYIKESLLSFTMSSTTTPGRLNFYTFNDFQVMIDYAHNPHGMKALGRFIKTMDVHHRVGIITGIGDRRDEDIVALGEEAARVFDEIIIRHDDDLRGRSAEDIDRLLIEGIRKADKDVPFIFSSHENEALEMCISNHQPNSIIVVLVEHVDAVTGFINNLHRQHLQENAMLRKAV